MAHGNLISYTPMINVVVKLESGSSWGDLTVKSRPITEDLKLYSGFTFVAGWVNLDATTIGWQCNLKPIASLALAEMTILKTLEKHGVGTNGTSN